MGGNGASDAYNNYTLDTYDGDRFKTVGKIGNTKVVTTTKKRTSSTPMNNFNSPMYYVTNPKDPGKIVTIAFYNKCTHKIRKTIDIVYDKDGNVMAYKNVVRKGKTHTVGTHVHLWPKSNKIGKAGRKSHDKTNVFEPSKSDLKYIKKAIKYNKSHNTNKRQAV